MTAVRTHPAAGFALIELLVAIALLGLIMAMVGGSLRSAARLTAAGEARVAANAQIDALQGLLRRQLEAILPLALPGAAPNAAAPEWLFQGDGVQVRFAVRRPSSLLPGGLYLARLGLGAADPAGRLLASWQRVDPSRPLAAQAGPTQTVRLLDQVAGLRLRYFGRQTGDSTTWHEAWQASDRLPELISIELQPTTAASWRWPPLIVAPRLGTPLLPSAAAG